MTKGYTQQFDGITRYARAHNWNVIPIECQIAGETLYCTETHEPLHLNVILTIWNADGMIVDYFAAKIVYRCRNRIHVPMIFPDHRPEDLGPDAVCVHGDADAISRMAAQELFALGYVNYAFVPAFPDEPSWSHDRAKAFETIVNRAGRTLHRFKPPVGKTSTTATLRSWLGKLPKPCSVFCANDLVASNVRNLCSRYELRIPEDIAILGVDNRLEICETSEPTLSSIQQNLEECYYLASKTLDRMIDGHPLGDIPHYGVLRTVRRASTSKLTVIDNRIKKALEFIRLHTTEHIAPTDVVKVMGCGRTYADLRFRTCIGHSIVTEISLRRVELVKEALARPTVRMADLAETCGFASDVDMRRVFKKLTGMSPREWRKRL